MNRSLPWRLISLSAADGATNMAFDEAILEAHLHGDVPPTLRLYRFSPPAVSIGRTQSVPPGLMEAARRRSLELVRRPTGGRAVLHCQELTYSFVGKTRQHGIDGGFLSDSIALAYKEICAGLQEALAILGVALSLGEANKPYRQLHDCFLATTGSDLHWNGRKMVGSAQLRRKQGVLQHGSILLDQEQSLMPSLLGESPGNGDNLERHANLFEAIGRAVGDDELCEAMRGGFERAFGVRLVEGGLTDSERQSAEALRHQYVIAGEYCYSETTSSTMPDGP